MQNPTPIRSQTTERRIFRPDEVERSLAMTASLDPRLLHMLTRTTEDRAALDAETRKRAQIDAWNTASDSDRRIWALAMQKKARGTILNNYEELLLGRFGATARGRWEA